jgi:hypothetical protein
MREIALCAVCRAHAGAHGYGFRNQPHIGACDDPRCIALLPKVYAMPKNELDAYEVKAIAEGGDVAGSYLDEVGAYDLRTMKLEQWNEFCKRLVTGSQDALRRMIEQGEAPF